MIDGTGGEAICFPASACQKSLFAKLVDGE